jgi:tetratricopeptide (TPR) repeat protein
MSAKLEKEREDVLKILQSALSDKEKNCTDVLSVAENYLKKIRDIRVLEAKGICEFRSEKYEQAKASFKQILALDPEHKAARNYLDVIDKILSGTIKFVNPKTDFLSRDFVEQKLGFNFNPQKYEFKEAARVSLPNAPVLQFVANYFTEQKFDRVLEDISSLLKQNNIALERDLTMIKEKEVVYVARQSAANEPFKGFTISVFNLKPVSIVIFYER